MGISNNNKIKRVEVRCRDNFSDLFKFDQLYCALNSDGDIHVNGSVEMIAKEYGNIERIKVYANLCDKEGAILYVLYAWKNYHVNEDVYRSFSLYCSTVGRFFDVNDLDYVELYFSTNEKDLEGN